MIPMTADNIDMHLNAILKDALALDKRQNPMRNGKGKQKKRVKIEIQKSK